MKKIILIFIVLLIVSCSPKIFKEKWTNKKAPDQFKARFETTQGDFDIIAKREWHGDHLRNLRKPTRGFFSYTNNNGIRTIWFWRQASID